jgi:hypothetical protein
MENIRIRNPGWPRSRVTGIEIQAEFKIRICSDFGNLKERIRKPDPESQ